MYELFVNKIKKTKCGETILGSISKYIDSTHSFTVTHESRNLKQARPFGQYVDLLRFRCALATPSQQNVLLHSCQILSRLCIFYLLYIISSSRIYFLYITDFAEVSVMHKKLIVWQLIGLVFTSIAGTLLHFLYDWSNESSFVAPFSAVNESIWEHMKLLFVPMFLFALIENHFLGMIYENFWCVKLAGILLGIITIPILYYTYTGILGVSKDWFNIVIFFISAAIAYVTEIMLFKREPTPCRSSLFALFILCLLALTFVVLTYLPPKIPLFQDPQTGDYGVYK